MGDIMPDFCDLFYNIQGNVLSDRKKNFQKLLKNPCFKQDSIQLHHALADLNPRNYLEGLFKVDALIYFKRKNELQDILKGGNEVYISKLLKQIWFIKEVFENMACEEFVNKFMPTMPYTFKIKFIKKIYGLPLAKTVIHRCSAGKINNIFEQYEIKLTANQEKHLFDRDQNLFLKYILQHNQAFHKYDERKVIDYVALKNSQFFLELKQKDAFVLHKLGRQTTKKVFNVVKEEVLDNADVHKDILKLSVMVRMLGKEFDIVFDKKFPNNFHDESIDTLRSSTAFQLLPLCSKNKRWHLFYETYTKKFPEKGLSDVLSVIDDYIMKLNADKGIIDKWAQTKYKESNSEEYLKYYTDVLDATSIIKGKINVTSDKSSRIRLVKLLVEACDINNDPTTLEKVLAYIVKRHRNEDAFLKSEILRAISGINIEKHWQHIRSLVKVVKVQKDLPYRGIVQEFDQNYIVYLIKNNQTIEDVVKEYLAEYDQDEHEVELDFADQNIHSKFIQEVLRMFPQVVKSKNVSEVFCYAARFSTENPICALDLRVFSHLVEFVSQAMESKKIDYETSQLVKHLFLYNISCPEYEIPIERDYMLRFLAVQIDESYVYIPDILEKIILKKERTSFENKVFELFWASVDKHSAPDLVDWFIFHDPMSILPYFDKISTMSASGNFHTVISDKAMTVIKYYSHFGFDKKLSEKYVNKVLSLLNLDPEAVKSADTIRSLVKQLPKLLSTAEFIKLVLKCIPEKEKIDIEDQKMKVVYSLQSDVISVLHKVAEPSKMLPALMTFCAGDYLRHALQPLYSIMCRSSEEEIRPCVDVLAKRAMSVRKHALCLTTLVLDKETVMNTLKNAKSQDISENKSIFLKTVKYFKKNPSKELFHLCTENLKIVDKNDIETLDLLTSIEVPRQYKVEFLECCWIFFEDLGKNDVKVEKYLNSLMITILFDNRIVAALSSRFVQKIIHEYFTTNIRNVKLFTLTVLFCRISERLNNFKAVFNILKDFPYKKVHCFVNDFFEFLQHNKEAMKDDVFLEMFYEYWRTYFPLDQTLQDHISLEVLTRYRKSQSKELFAHNVVDYFEEILEKYGCLVLNIFKGGLDRLLNILETPDKYTFYLNAVKYKPRAELFVLIIMSIRNVVSSQSEEVTVNVYKDLINILETADDDICKIHYQYYLVKNG
nr:unnamed protein product [Callosobruchus chinensis]